MRMRDSKGRYLSMDKALQPGVLTFLDRQPLTPAQIEQALQRVVGAGIPDKAPPREQYATPEITKALPDAMQLQAVTAAALSRDFSRAPENWPLIKAALDIIGVGFLFCMFAWFGVFVYCAALYWIPEIVKWFATV